MYPIFVEASGNITEGPESYRKGTGEDEENPKEI